MVARTMTAAQLDALCLPSASEIADAVSRIPHVERGSWRAHDARPGSFLEVGPGMVRFYRSAAHLPDAARDRVQAVRVSRIDSQIREERALYRSPMALLGDLDVQRLTSPGDVGSRAPRGRITGWSARSKRRLDMEIRRIDFRPLFADNLAPAMITLTLPGEWEHLAPNPAAFKKMVDRFTSAYRDSWGGPVRGVWKMEFQRRGAPHMHILMTPPQGVARGAFPMEFRPWLSRAWARAVGATGDERQRHERAGTGVDWVEDRYRDPHRIATYFAKEGFAKGKAYQNDMPDLWLKAIDDGEGGARFWGVWGLPKASAVLQLDDAGSISVETLIDPLGVSRLLSNIKQHYQRSDDGTWVLVEERQPHATDASVMRAYQRMADEAGSLSADDVLLQRYLRKLSKARAHRSATHVRNQYGQPVLPPESIRRVKFEQLDPATGELRQVKRYRVGYYHGGSGAIHVHDGRSAARDVERMLVALSARRESWTPDRLSGVDRIIGRDLDGTLTVEKILLGGVS